MIEIAEIQKLVEEAVAQTDAFIVDLSISPQQDIVVELDSPTGVDLDFCARLTHELNEALPESEDYSLEVGSSSLTAPFKVPRQFEKHIGDPVEVLTTDGRKLHGILKASDSKGFTLVTTVKQRVEGKKKPVLVEKEETFPYEGAKQVVYELKF